MAAAGAPAGVAAAADAVEPAQVADESALPAAGPEIEP
jgi:hypothetical protein